MLTTPFLGKAKSKVFLALFENPLKRYHMRALERKTQERINAVREALISFVSEKIITEEVVGKKKFFQANPHYLYYDELLRIASKQHGLGARILKERMRLGKIKCAFITEHLYRFEDGTDTPIDLFIVGTVSLKEIERITKEEAEGMGREINYSVMEESEYMYRLKNKDPFIAGVLRKQRVMLIGFL